MTTFVAGLVLPYTVSFNVEPSRPRTAIDRPMTRESDGTTVSLFQRRAALAAVQTPGATTDQERIFMLPEHQEGFKLTLPSRHMDPRSIARTDPLSPSWGAKTPAALGRQVLQQPASRALSPPPASVTRHNRPRERTASIIMRASKEYMALGHGKGRDPSHERKFSHDNFTVEPGQLSNGGLTNAIKAASDEGVLTEKTWVGTLGMPTDALDQHLKTSIAEKLQHDYESLTVFVDDNDFDGHYLHYCKIILWPVFHYQIPDHPKSKAYEEHSYEYYVKVNQAFADRIAKDYKKGDVIWIHDYHLLLVPGMLRKLLPDAQIGFFLHIAFPSSEIFRCLPVRKQLLEGMLGANLIGFQTDEYCHHFLQTCSRLLCIEATNHGVYLEDRFVNVNTFPLGIDPKQLDLQRAEPKVADMIKVIAEKYEGKRLIVAREKLDNIRGVRQKMLAYELFLNKYPESAQDVVLIQVTDANSEQEALDATVSDIVTRINSVHSTLAHQPIVYLRQDIPHNDFLALLTVAECLMITSLREGMNLTSHEYIYCQDGKYFDKKYGPLILSEFTGSAAVLDDRELLVNPWDYNQCADAIKKALEMSYDERRCRWHHLYGSIMHHTAMQWFRACSQHLHIVCKEHQTRDNASVPRLSFTPLKEKYDAANRRLFIIDYEGTTASWGSPTDTILTTPKRTTDTLMELIADDKNIVYLMSARMPEELERLFRQVPGLGLIAENGCFLMEPDSDEWIELTDIEHAATWKPGVTNILQYYSDRIEGSKIEQRHCSLIYDFTRAEDKEAALKQAGEIQNHINDAALSCNVHVTPVETALVVALSDVNKALGTKYISDSLELLRDEKEVPLPDFLMVIGDSRDDEVVFNWAHKMEKKGIRDVTTVTLSSKSTEASATMAHGVTGVLSTLQKLAAT